MRHFLATAAIASLAGGVAQVTVPGVLVAEPGGPERPAPRLLGTSPAEEEETDGTRPGGQMTNQSESARPCGQASGAGQSRLDVRSQRRPGSSVPV